MNSQFLGDHHIVHLSTKAMRDLNGSGYASDVINMHDWQDCVFIMNYTSGVGADEVSIIRCDDTTPTSTAGAPSYRYRASTVTDTWGVWNEVTTSSGFITPITPDKMYEIHIRGDEVGGSSGWEYIRLKTAEVTNSPCDLDIIAILFNGRYLEDTAARTSLT